MRNMLHAAHIQLSASLCGRDYVRLRCCGEQLRSVGSYIRQIQARTFKNLVEICEEYAIVPVTDTMSEYQTLEDATARSIYAPNFTSNSAAGDRFVQPWKDMSSALQQVQVCSTNISQWGGPRVPGFDDAVKSAVCIEFNLQWLRAHVGHAVTAFIDAERINQFLDELENESSAATVQEGEEAEVEHVFQPAVERAFQASPSLPATTRVSPETPEAPVAGPDGGRDSGPDSNGESSSHPNQQIGEHRVAHHESLYDLNLERFAAKVNSYRGSSNGPLLQQSEIATLFHSLPPPPRSGRTTIGHGVPSPDEDIQMRSASGADQIASQHNADPQPSSAEQSQGESDQSVAAENTAAIPGEAAMFSIPDGLRKAYQDRLEGHRRAVSAETNAEQMQGVSTETRVDQLQDPLQNTSSTPTDAGTREVIQNVRLPRKKMTKADIQKALEDPETDARMGVYLRSERLPEHSPGCKCTQCKKNDSEAGKAAQMPKPKPKPKPKPAYKRPAMAKTPGNFLQDVKGYGGEGQPPYYGSKELERLDRDADSSVLEAVIEMSGGNTSNKSRMGEVFEHFSKWK